MSLIESEIEVFIGYLNTREHIILGVSKNKKILRYYLNTIRKLNKGDYIIETTDMLKSDYYIKYQKVILEEYENSIYLPRRDIEMIDDNISDLPRTIATTIKNIQDLALVYQEIDSKKFNIENFTGILNILSKTLDKDKLYSKVESGVALRDPVFTANISDYLKLLKIYKEERMMNITYRRLCEDD